MCALNGCQRIALEARFLNFIKRLPNGCMIWTGAQSSGGFQAKGKFKSRGGPYGSFSIGKDATGIKQNTKRAHVVWAFLTGRIPSLRVPEGYHLDHDCDSGTLCVEHTTLVPDKINLALRHTRPKCRATASAVTQEVRDERRARDAKAKRARASRASQRLPGNSLARRAPANP